MTQYPTICLLFAVLFPMVCSFAETEGQKDARLISTFQVVRFPNSNCQGSNNRNGTCYTSQECSSKSGTSAGSCADGFGVCCTFIINTCGSTSSENLTVWQSPTTVTTGSCPLTICPTSDDICSLRLDFTTFTLTGPSTLSTANVRRRLGQAFADLQEVMDADAQDGSTFTTNCFVDNFYVTSASPSSTPPAICGTETGQHMYVEADTDRCNLLRFSIGDATTLATQLSNTRGVTATATRAWDITITQIECTSLLVPPTGCTKYWYGAGVAVLTNYNYQTAVAAANAHLSMQHERMCIRRERGMCVGCFYTRADTDFAVSFNAAMNIAVTGGCCGYGTRDALAEAGAEASVISNGVLTEAADQQFGWDCVIIPGAFVPVIDAEGSPLVIQTQALIQQSITNSPTEANGPAPSGPQICGSGAGLGIGKADLDIMIIGEQAADTDLSSGVDNTICTRNVPFQLEFMSDDIEGLGASAAAAESEVADANQQYNQGFSIDFVQYAC